MQSMTIRVWEQGDTVFGRLTLPLRGGGLLSILVSLTSKQVIEAMKRAGIKFSASELAAIGSVFGSIGKFIKKAAKSSVLKGLMKVGAKLGGPLLKAVVPGAAAALEAANGALKLIQAAKGGGAKAGKAKLALKAATAQADLETKNGGQMPVPSGVAAKGPAAAAAFRYLVTVKHAEGV
ncbi:MAG TPA: hypothetical protein VJS18_21165 [Paraburkholderia sp.]|nr:hypothetical protein [Paraburkholderia sp.]